MTGDNIDPPEPYAFQREVELLESAESFTTSPLSVFVDVMELLHHLDGNEEKLWEFLGKLKDLVG